MHCRWVKDKEIGRFHLPGCWGAAIYGPGGCTCSKGKRERDLEDEVENLKERISKLETGKRTLSK